MGTPTMVYKKGSMLKHDGNLFDYTIVEGDTSEGEEQSELDKALEDGWFRTPAEALDGVPSDKEGPTRGELKAMADQLGLEYASNISTKKLGELVNGTIGS